ncbi:MAG: MMPL family transporter [Gammaproteobacteria bacterium]|nr:MMPL family transporter [Gammaproteobacteria bacterium]
MSASQGLPRAISRWVDGVQRRAPLVLLLALAGGVTMLWLVSQRLTVDTDNQNLISAQLPWRQAEQRLDREFPQLSNVLLVVIDADTPELADSAQRRLVAKLQSQPQLFEAVSAPEVAPFFQREGLLFLSLPQLRELGDELSLAQPFLGALAQNPSLDGLATLLQRALGDAGAAGFDLAPAFSAIAEGVRATTDGHFYQLSWQSLMGQGTGSMEASPKQRFIAVTPVFDYTQMLPAAKPIAAVRAAVAALHLEAAHGVRVRLTGDVAMEHEELQTATSGALLALSVAMVMVAALLFLALRSLRLVLAAVVTLIYGLLATAAFAAVAIGHLNMISVAFGVLYVGLGIDYALYLTMQYRERVGQGLESRRGLSLAAGDVGGFMMVCAATTSLGFFAFTPTDFTGIAELGLISGAGMFISLGLSLTLLPALIALLPPDAERIRLQPAGGGVFSRLAIWPYRYARGLWIGAALVAGFALLLVPRLSFDFNPLDLRDPHSESVTAFRKLLADPNIPTLTLSALAPNEADAQTLARRLAALPLVKQTLTLDSFVPDEQQAKLATIQDLIFTLGPELASAGDVRLRADPQDAASLRALAAALAGDQTADPSQATALRQALVRFDARLQQLPAAQRPALLGRLREALLGGLPDHLAQLATALQAQPVTRADLPPELVSRWIDAAGDWRVEVWPREILDNNAAIARFVDQVRGVAPTAVGPPVVALESGRAMVTAFRQAFTYSLIAITVLLLVLLRSLTDTLLVLIPLALAALYTLASMVLLGVPLNFANIIALPLVLGVGVDYGVYIVQRGREAAREGVNLLQTSTARAVTFGGLITIANFGNLMLAKHPGMVSMGLLLTLGLAATLFCALVLLPSLIARRYGAPRVDF